MSNSYKFIRRFCDISMADVPVVGGKNASLGEMFRTLMDKGVHVPNGFATTADAYRQFLQHNDLAAFIDSTLGEINKGNIHQLEVAGAKIRHALLQAEFPPGFIDEVADAYHELEREYGHHTDVAVRSSATAEDLPDASFAGQQETYLNVSGLDQLLWICKKVYASLYTNRAISYRMDKGFEHDQVALSVGVQKMVRSDKGSSGVMFTLDTESGFRDVVLITGAYGLGENVVQGAVNPDEFHVFKPALKAGKRPVIARHLGEKAIKMVYASKDQQGTMTQNVAVAREERERFCISDDEVLQLAQFACVIEEHYSDIAGQTRPMDIEWAKDGLTNQLYIVQARPETVHSQLKSPDSIETYHLREHGIVVTRGKSVGRRIATGRARVILDVAKMDTVAPGDVLVTDITDPDWEPVMKIASAIVTNRGGRTCHAAIIARELGIPAIVGTETATQDIHDGQSVTVCCAEGDVGLVYDGALAFDVAKHPLHIAHRPQTKIMLNLADPDQAYEVAQLPNDGVGLARLEFIINNHIKAHPRALLQPRDLPENQQLSIQRLIRGYADGRDYYVGKLAEGMGRICAAFYPKPVIVRFSDFKTNEYAALLGGESYEPKEENPMIGFRGASRYPSEAFEQCFLMECEAVKRVREVMGLDNLAVMLPFVRTLSELEAVVAIMRRAGLVRGENGLKLYVMCEIPSNALLAEQFLAHCDGFSIGSNDFTQLTLGVDRDSSLVPGVDERDLAVKKLMGMAISAAKQAEKYVGICGQAPSDFPEITSWLVQQGISSISLNPDSVLPMTEVVLAEENILSQ